MRSTPLALALALTIGLTSASAFADNARGFYVGANFTGILADDLIVNEPMDEDDDLKLAATELMVGYKYNGYLGIDLRYGNGLGDKSLQFAENGRNEYSIDNYTSAYFRFESINDQARFYALLGYTELSSAVALQTLAGTTSSELDETESGLSAGLGAGWFFNNGINLNVELRNLMYTDDVSLPSVSVGLDYRI
ncbi:outer membrane beta-barrel protein [Teredinibacter turnerae]|uniref:outer membrane beta-barrel protein n=1 Tax=Teredinibacter turnerae TaxID=2426 RepID=UPI00041B68C6|nr:outer membrane beta-barrel protein [Teredinibacter turnerae]